jgi:hypothetical protein
VGDPMTPAENADFPPAAADVQQRDQAAADAVRMARLYVEFHDAHIDDCYAADETKCAWRDEAQAVIDRWENPDA